ncbi:MAG: hypothetical protein NZ942_04060 [Candidatus Aenigmarchaeota archaeon]|nr:hypothetical protein [Candidatus Aenigmarchaeota archaeon]
MKTILHIVQDKEVIIAKTEGLLLDERQLKKLTLSIAKKTYGSSNWLYCVSKKDMVLVIDFSQYEGFIKGLVFFRHLEGFYRLLAKMHNVEVKRQERKALKEASKLLLDTFSLGIKRPQPEAFQVERYRELAKWFSFISGLLEKLDEVFPEYKRTLNALKEKGFVDESYNPLVPIQKIVRFVYIHDAKIVLCPICLKPFPKVKAQVFCVKCSRYRHAITKRVSRLKVSPLEKNKINVSLDMLKTYPEEAKAYISFKKLVTLCKSEDYEKHIKTIREYHSLCKHLFYAPRKYSTSK